MLVILIIYKRKTYSKVFKLNNNEATVQKKLKKK